MKPRPKWKIKIEKLLENYYWVGVMTIVTFYALFMDDIRFLWLPNSIYLKATGKELASFDRS